MQKYFTNIYLTDFFQKQILTTHHKGLLSQGVQDGKGEGGRDRGGLFVPPDVFLLDEGEH